MANWAHVENNEITGRYDLLPTSWKNVSGLNLSKNNLPFLKSLGWYPVTKQVEDYDNTTHYITGYNYEIRENDVYETYILAEITPPVIDFNVAKNQFMQKLREERNKKLMECDWTQLTDVQNLFDESRKFQWQIYRQALRDITEIYLQNDVIEMNQINWPAIPASVQN